MRWESVCALLYGIASVLGGAAAVVGLARGHSAWWMGAVQCVAFGWCSWRMWNEARWWND